MKEVRSSFRHYLHTKLCFILAPCRFNEEERGADCAAAKLCQRPYAVVVHVHQFQTENLALNSVVDPFRGNGLHSVGVTLAVGRVSSAGQRVHYSICIAPTVHRALYDCLSSKENERPIDLSNGGESAVEVKAADRFAGVVL